MIEKVESFGKIASGAFVTSAENMILADEFMTAHEGEIVRRIYKIGKPTKTAEQIALVYVCLSGFGKYLGIADLADLKNDVKESIGYYEIKEVKDLRKGKSCAEKIYKSFADLEKDSPYIEAMFNLCDEMGFPMRRLYDICKTHGIEVSKNALARFLQEKII